MTKADRIRQLAQEHPDWKTGQIGKACDCRPEYVRVVLRQRVGGGQSDIDRRYDASPLGQAKRRREVHKIAAYDAVMRRTGDLHAARSAAIEAYARARLDGLHRTEAAKAASYARLKVLRQTGDKQAARAAYASIREASP
jgi:hypothetical protein